MWWPTENEARAEIKARAIAKRVYKYGACGDTCYCDYCGTAPGYEYHEIISRGRTISDDETRRLSFDERICSVLCHNCHANYAPTHIGRFILLVRNIEIYGREAVEDAFYHIPKKFREGIELP